ncbi:60 kDa SS-A/Ro ribonucleoprotein [Nilaparvata lugens]|uniref:60 kDa SS-A/Ro ribonucleoprotein n=1 Tax=Nilaparvata lugens TaxID=108931 RepID=UPI00193D2DE7|nr:60 kDa SS-A/Ro ribonucleoprotein [Nilaparvata lugens]
MAASPEVRLKRFLHYGSELPVYNASRGLLTFTDKSCPSIPTLIEAGKDKEVGLQIVKAHSDGYAVRREALLYAMAICALNKKSDTLREMIYNGVKTVCAKAEDLFLFFVYLQELNNNKLNSGKGLRRLISDWYLKRDVMEFAEIVSKKRGYFHWSHVDLMKIAHIKTDDPAKQVVIAYAFKNGNNIKELKEKYKGVKEAAPVLQYLKVASEVRYSKDPKTVSRAIEANSLSLGHLPQHTKEILYSEEVWCSLLTGMPLEEMLDNLQYVSRHQMLRAVPRGQSKLLTRRYCDALGNTKTLAESNVHPARILIERSTYQLIAKEKIGLAAKLKHSAVVRKPPPPNEEIIEELGKLMDSAFKLLVPTGQRYVVGLDARILMFARRCWKNRYVNCADAAALLALSLVRCEREVTVGLYGGSQAPFKPVQLGTNESLDSLLAKMKAYQTDDASILAAMLAGGAAAAGAETGGAKVPLASQMLEWAETEGVVADVFVAIGESQLTTVNLNCQINKYRNAVNAPNAKLVHVHLNGPAKVADKSRGNGLLAIHGFDKNVPRVIEAFARGAF